MSSLPRINQASINGLTIRRPIRVDGFSEDVRHGVPTTPGLRADGAENRRGTPRDRDGHTFTGLSTAHQITGILTQLPQSNLSHRHMGSTSATDPFINGERTILMNRTSG